jgi:hypothetical protein
MVVERYYGPGIPYYGFRCLSCGEILDPVIWENRKNLFGAAQAKNQGASIGNSRRG